MYHVYIFSVEHHLRAPPAMSLRNAMRLPGITQRKAFSSDVSISRTYAKIYPEQTESEVSGDDVSIPSQHDYVCEILIKVVILLESSHQKCLI